MQLAFNRFLKSRGMPAAGAPRLAPRPGATPATAYEQLLLQILQAQGPMAREDLVARLAGALRRRDWTGASAATLDAGVWGAAVSRAEADRVVRQTADRLLVEVGGPPLPGAEGVASPLPEGAASPLPLGEG